MSDAEINRLLAEAMKARAAGRGDLADTHFRAVLTHAPQHAGALNALGMSALARGEAAEAADLFLRAAGADPSAPALWLNLAKARRLLSDDEGERGALARVLEIDQRHMMALIRLAQLHERRGEHKEALQRWSGGLAVGRALDQRPPELEALLAHAAAYVAERTSALADALERALDEPLAGVAERERKRFLACRDYMLGRRTIYANQCAGLHYPFLPADEYFERRHFPWLARLEAQTPAIRAEFEALSAAPDAGFAPYVAMEPGTPPNKWSPLDNSMDWGSLHLWREGRRIEAACARAPRTAAIMEALPLAQIPNRAPTVFFSVLRPHSRIPPHTGVSNARTVIHLPLFVPEGCGFRVGGETRQWRVGEAFAFDDTIEHEAWNESGEPRAILILDVWNPYLSEAERGLLRTMYEVVDGSGQAEGLRTGLAD